MDIDWFRNYLTNRRQFVKYNGDTSLTQCTKIGIPQGSVLGPLLFLIFTNDLPQSCANSSLNLFADDAITYKSSTSVYEAYMKIQESLESLQLWYYQNKLSVNIKKCLSMCIGPDSSQNMPVLYMNNEPIENVLSAIYLGLEVDNELNWSKHILKTCTTINNKLFHFRSLCKFLPHDTLNNIYTTYIQPYFDYACTIWGQCAEKDLKQLQRLQNRAARLITKEFDYRNVRGLSLAKKLKWQSVKERIHYMNSVMMFKCLNNEAPNYLCDNFTKLQDLNDYNTRASNSNVLLLPSAKSNAYRNSLSFNGASVWNGLHENIRMQKTLTSF